MEIPNFNVIPFTNFPFTISAFWVLLKKSLLSLNPKALRIHLPVLSSISFIVLLLIVRSTVHLGLIYAYGEELDIYAYGKELDFNFILEHIDI